jgi:hypothetical protein
VIRTLPTDHPVATFWIVVTAYATAVVAIWVTGLVLARSISAGSPLSYLLDYGAQAALLCLIALGTWVLLGTGWRLAVAVAVIAWWLGSTLGTLATVPLIFDARGDFWVWFASQYWLLGVGQIYRGVVGLVRPPFELLTILGTAAVYRARRRRWSGTNPSRASVPPDGSSEG